jgi:disintegrin and metalloproteinase domain-containing protein 10
MSPIFCRDFTGGTLGLAWVASASGASGGICEKYKTYTENINGVHHTAKRSLNTGPLFLLFFFKLSYSMFF